VEPALRIPEFQPDLRHRTTSESSSSSSGGSGGGSGGGDADAAVLAGDKMSSSPARRHRPRSTVCRRRRVMEDRGHMAGKAPPHYHNPEGEGSFVSRESGWRKMGA